MKDLNKQLIHFIASCPSMFHTADTVSGMLEEKGFERLKESRPWDIKAGGKYYVVRNNSSVIAFDIPKKIKDYHFQTVASHGDSPTYKIKAEGELKGPAEYLRLDVEGYGGMLDATWFDRPLSIAGRVLVNEDGKTVSKLLYIDKDILIIPSLCIHMNREANSGFAYNRAVDLCPLFSAGELKKGDFDRVIAKELKVRAEDIVSKDLFLVNRQEGKIWGYKKEFVSTPKLDDLQAAFASLMGFLESENKGSVNVYVCFDNEEVGSGTKQGAMSTFLKDTLERINAGLGKKEEDLRTALAKSFLVSFDNAHALHPNHPEKSDSINQCFMNKGLVIKENASQRYTTDAFSRAVFKEVCEKAEVPTQVFANRSDMAGGGTLGNISNAQVSQHAVDIGIAQLAMHSSYETAGSRDTEYGVQAIKEFYSSLVMIEDADSFSIE